MDKREQEFEEEIRQKLAGGSVDFDEGAWTKMERRLDGRKGWVAMLPLWGRAAAIVLLAGLGFWLYRGYFSDEANSPVKTHSVMTEESGVGAESTARGETSAETSETPLTPADAEHKTVFSDPVNERFREKDPERTAIAAIGHADHLEMAGISQVGTPLEAKWPSLRLAAGNGQHASEGDGSGRDGSGGNASRRNGVGFSLSMLAAPDLNGVGGFTGGKAGFNAGLGVGIHFSDRLSLHTGIIYAKKPYNASPSDYHARYSPQGLMNIAARCEVIDIPLNLQYTLFEKGRSRLAVQAGLSSYLMLNEQYRYEFGNDDPRDYEYRNENQHWMGVGNAGLVLERELGKGLSLGLKPFVKVPLTGIGHGDVRLVSAGAALQLNLAIGKQKIYK